MAQLKEGSTVGGKPIVDEIKFNSQINQITQEIDDKLTVLSEDVNKKQEVITQHLDNYNEHVDDDVAHNHYGVATGTNTLIVTLLSPPTTLVAGFALRFKNTTANTGNVTLNVNGLGAKPIVKNGGIALSSGNLKEGGVYTVCYDGNSFILQGEGGEYGNAGANDVRRGKTIGTDNGLVTGTLAPLEAGNLYVYSYPYVYGIYYSNYRKIAGCRVSLGSTYRVEYSVSGIYNGTTYARIYVNGIPVGIERAFAGSLTTMVYTEDITIKDGDTIEIWARVVHSDYNTDSFGSIQTFRLGVTSITFTSN